MTWLYKNTPAVLADLVGFALIVALMPLLILQFQNLGFFNTVVIGAFFVLFCLAVYGLKKLRPSGGPGLAVPAFLLEKRALGALGVLFALSLSLATAYVAGFLDSVVALNRDLLDEPSVTIYLLLTPASWFGLALIYMLVLTSETEASVESMTARYWFVSFLGLAGVNLMGVGLTAVWRALWERFGAAPGATSLVALNFVLYLFLLGPPRLIYLARNGRLIAVVTFLVFILTLALLAAS
jgi:hypothetical protein